nr:oxidized low-density lipoprotein receptor 1-like [Anolis sagrei ordinatus]
MEEFTVLTCSCLPEQDTNGAAAKETTAEKAPGATKKKNAAEREKTANLRTAVRKISRFMKVQEPRLRTQLDIDVLNETQKYADILASWSAKIVELDEAITDITKRIANDWNVHGGSLFLFQTDKHTFNRARHACTTRDSVLTSIDSPEEEEFIESRVKGSLVDYWIGLYKGKDDWVWEEGRPLIRTSRVVLAVAGCRALCICHVHSTDIFEHFNPCIDDSTNSGVLVNQQIRAQQQDILKTVFLLIKTVH